jgi:hypothetical protein
VCASFFWLEAADADFSMESWRRGQARFFLFPNPELSSLHDIVCIEGDGVLLTEGAGDIMDLLSDAFLLMPSNARRWLSFCFFLRGDLGVLGALSMGDRTESPLVSASVRGGAFLVTTELALASVLEGAFVGDIPDVFSDLAEAAFLDKALRDDRGVMGSISDKVCSSPGAFGEQSVRELDESHRVSARDTDGSVFGGSAVSAPFDASCDDALEGVFA